MLKKIKSKFILNTIIDYIKEDNKLQIFLFSKYYQQILGIKLLDYQQQYFNKKGIELDDLKIFFSPIQIRNNNFNRNILKDNLKLYLNKNNIKYDLLKSYLIEYNKCLIKDLNKENEQKKPIDIYSPFFDDLLKNRCLEFFIIQIDFEFIEKFQLYNDYKDIFDKLNIFKSNFCIKISFKNENVISLIKDFKINFELLKGLDMINIGNEKNINYDSLFKNLFDFNNLGKNIINLNLKVHDVWSKIDDSKNFEKINSFKNLKTLELNGFNFQKKFILNLNDIIFLNLRNCSNIILAKNNKLKTLFISNCNILKNISLSKFENLEKIELSNYKNSQKYFEVFDFSCFVNLKFLNCQTCDFIHLPDTSSLEKAYLISTISNNLETEKLIFEKICKLQKLKEISFDIYTANIEDILNINYNNPSLEKMYIGIKKELQNANFYGLINKFNNLSELKVDFQAGEEYFTVNLKIKETNNCKVNKLYISGCGASNIELYCGPYLNLVEIKLYENGNITNLKDTFPLFKENCPIIFNKLTNFHFINMELSTEPFPFEVINNLYNNLNKMPNLKNITIKCYSSEMNKDYYKHFIKKLLEMKLDSITLDIHQMDEEDDSLGDNYTFEELKEIYPLILKNKKYDIAKYEIEME